MFTTTEIIIFAALFAILLCLIALLFKNKGSQIEPAITDDEIAKIKAEILEENQQQLQHQQAKDAEIRHLREQLANTEARSQNEQIALLNQQINNVGNNVEQLHRLFRNIKIRGIWGEAQLKAILEQTLNQNQYDENVAVNPMASHRVEFALKLPLPDKTHLLLPIDAKCPIEDYQRFVEALENGDQTQQQTALRNLEKRLLQEAADIKEKYIHPPYSTDFALMFLPIEGIYQTMLTNSDLVAKMEREFRVIPTSPATISAVLNILQLSYQTMSIEAQSAEVWQLLGTVKKEFADFGNVLEKNQKKNTEMANNLEELARRIRVMEKKLRDVENL